MNCSECGLEHETSLEHLACIDINGPWLARQLRADLLARLNAQPDEAWRAALDQAGQRRRALRLLGA